MAENPIKNETYFERPYSFTTAWTRVVNNIVSPPTYETSADTLIYTTRSLAKFTTLDLEGFTFTISASPADQANVIKSTVPIPVPLRPIRKQVFAICGNYFRPVGDPTVNHSVASTVSLWMEIALDGYITVGVSGMDIGDRGFHLIAGTTPVTIIDSLVTYRAV